jgi:transcription factor IIIB subunit 2
MHAFIRTLSRQLESPGISTRAQTLFDQAMSTGNPRWGRKAKLTAGACVAIALRESHKSDSLRDISVSIIFLLMSFDQHTRLLT